MEIAIVLTIVVVVGAIIAFISPGFARVLGWLTLALTLLGSGYVLVKFSGGGSELPGQISMIIGVVIALVILVLGGALAFGLLAPSSAVKTVALEQLERAVDGASAATVEAGAAMAVGLPQGAKSGGILRGRRSHGANEVALLRQGFAEGRQPDRDDIAVLAHAALTDPDIARLTDRVSGDTLLHWCARLDLPDAAARLLASGANPDAPNGRGLRALAGSSPEFMQRLQHARRAAG